MRSSRRWRVGARILGLTDLVEFPLQAQTVELFKRKADENVDAVVEHARRVGEGVTDLGFGTGGCRRIGHTCPYRKLDPDLLMTDNRSMIG
jgi:hypothetical protein